LSNNIKNKLLLLNIGLLIALIYLGLLIFNIDIQSLFRRPVCNHCNVILISLDTLGAEHLPCYGYDRNTAPNLCNFAKNNILFSNAFSNASWTLPSHFSIFTSLYPKHHIMVNDVNHQIMAGDFTNKLDPSIITMAEYFKKANYKTIYIGPITDPTLSLQRGIGKGFENIFDSLHPNYTLESWDKGISQLIANNKKKENTFLFLHTYWVHDPYLVDDVPDGNIKRIYTKNFYPDISLNRDSYYKFSQNFLDFILVNYENKIKTDDVYERKNDQNIINSLRAAKSLIEAEKIYLKLIPNFSTREGFFSEFYFKNINKSNMAISYDKSLYDELIYRLDKQMTLIFSITSNTELANNTIIIITSDHGEEFMEHGSLGHPADHLYNTITAIPLIMYVPGIKQKKIDNLVQSIDILPTILNLTGIKNSNNYFDGIDLTDSILGRWFPKKNDYLISEGPNDSIRNDRWKLYVDNLQRKKNINELYDLYKDPREKSNIAKENPKIVKDLQDKLDKIIYKK